MDWTDVHYRQLARIMSKHTWLWTEMVVDKTILHAPRLDEHLWFPPEQHPIVLQVGGSDPDTLRQAAAKAAQYGYDEINLNCGCPSDRVAGAGCFGASMMLQPELVARCMTVRGGCRGWGLLSGLQCSLHAPAWPSPVVAWARGTVGRWRGGAAWGLHATRPGPSGGAAA